jgi:transposase
MGKIKEIEINSDDLFILDKTYKTHENHTLRKRCHIILLKNKGNSSKLIGNVLDMEIKTVNNWVNRYIKYGLEGLKQKKGQGRKAILEEKDLESIKLSVEQHRQRVDKARVEWEENNHKKVGKQAFKNFLKSMVADINA